MRQQGSVAAATAVFIACSFHAAGVAQGACNTLPSMSSLGGNELPPALESAAGALPFRGALGRIDRVEFTPSGDDATAPDESVVVVGPDGCGGGVFDGINSRNDVIVTYVFEQAGREGRPRVMQFAALAQHAALTMLGATEAKKGFAFNGVFPNGDVMIVLAEVAGREEIRLRIPVPSVAQILGLEADDGPHFDNTRVVVTRRDATPPLSRLVAKNCAGLAFTDDDKPLACIDTIYGNTPTSCAISLAAQDPFGCNATTSFGERVDFGKQCYPGSKSKGKPKECKKDPTRIRYVADDCGNLRIRFSWRSIAFNDNNDAEPREVRGFSGISRTATGVDEPIRIPGKEFLASTRNKSGGGDPYKPKFHADPNSSYDSGMDLKGVADKGRSTLWFLPRLPAKYVCQNTNPVEACMGIVNDQPACVCPPGRMRCCGPPIAPKYFACSADSEFPYQPCTNSSHCGSGTCNVASRCVPQMTVWSPNPPQGNLCTEDGIAGGCASDEEQCGYSLFEHRDQAGVSVLREVDYIIADSAGTNRGVCMQDFTRSCGVAGSEGCLLTDGTDVGPCIAYYFQAEDVVP